LDQLIKSRKKLLTVVPRAIVTKIIKTLASMIWFFLKKASKLMDCIALHVITIKIKCEVILIKASWAKYCSIPTIPSTDHSKQKVTKIFLISRAIMTILFPFDGLPQQMHKDFV
jgi:hypothetical protein